ncbi:MAG: ATP-dependent sacrificial sulfur transferase LarE [Deltaproteobacteria bacterium]|nr:ATP-dependent sacrificial sulfur transferase LarE [Deltaproteobacteria bacterium]
MNTDTQNKKQKLISILKKYDHLIVAFSGGVDSTFLLYMANKVIQGNVIAATAHSSIHPKREIKFTKKLAKSIGVKHLVIPSREMNLPDFVENTKEKCYLCKKSLAQDLLKMGSEMGVSHIAHGANLDDLDDYRPGFKAAVEMGMIAPLLDAKMTKKDIRMLSKEVGLETWDKPSMACLASRIPYGVPIIDEALNKVDQAEEFIRSLGFISCRVRYHHEVARIEVNPKDFKKVFDDKIRIAIINRFKEIGFSYISVDLEGYIQGSMNRSISLHT